MLDADADADADVASTRAGAMVASVLGAMVRFESRPTVKESQQRIPNGAGPDCSWG